MASCRHESFRVDAVVDRILDGREEDAGGELVAFSCNLRVSCECCGRPFGGRGVPCGITVNGAPMRSADALGLRAWLVSPSELDLIDGPAGLLAP